MEHHKGETKSTEHVLILVQVLLMDSYNVVIFVSFRFYTHLLVCQCVKNMEKVYLLLQLLGLGTSQ